MDKQSKDEDLAQVDGCMHESIETTYTVTCPKCERIIAEWTDEMLSDSDKCNHCNVMVNYGNEY